jgi:carbamoyltransferase
VGLGGRTRNACVALGTDDRIIGICEQERITRVRAAGFNSSGLPDEALDELLRRSDRHRREATRYVIAESGPDLPPSTPVVSVDHHFAHACSAFLPSPFETATIVVCDDESPQVSVWDGNGTTVARVDWPWKGLGFAKLYSQCAEVLGFGCGVGGHEQRMEALARLNPDQRAARVCRLFGLAEGRLLLERGWQACISSWMETGAQLENTAAIAAALQARIGDLLIEFLAEVRLRTPTRQQLCVGGSLFHNSYFNGRVKRCGGFDEVFVPINPGNAGLAVGVGLHLSEHARQVVTPFLGPAYCAESIKATLDNCKLSYDRVSETDTIEISVEALQKGRIVAWFEGSMEWGPRALGARSILANPFAPYVLDNLNGFLKQRATWRGYALSGLEPAVREHFEGPETSPFMECDYVPRDRERFGHVLPGRNANVRVHTVGPEAPLKFRSLLEAFGEVSGIPILVNTSFNGFREPIVCSPRDAVRVFFGTGVDTLVLDRFVLSK